MTHLAEVGAGTSVWTVEGDKEKALGEDGEDLSDNEDGDDSTKESKTKLLQKSTRHDTLIIFYKRRPIRDGRQIVEKNKRQGLAFSKKLRDSAHWGPEAVEAEFALEAI